MKKILKTILMLALFAGAFYYFRNSLENIAENLYSSYFPCRSPIAYSIGSFDARFGISKADFIKYIGQAENIWETPSVKQLFAYKESGDLNINLIYDYRQEATDKLQKLGLVVKEDKNSYDTLKAKYTALQADYTQKKSLYEAAVASFDRRKKAYEAEVEYWNKHGHITETAYNQINSEKDALNEEIQNLNQIQTALNAQVDEINNLVTVLNRLANSLNLDVVGYNRVGESAGAEFEEGDYQQGPGYKKIDIYQFDNSQKLVRVLAHELGHALGLEHINNPKAIMYKLNQGTNETLTADDLLALKKHCGLK